MSLTPTVFRCLRTQQLLFPSIRTFSSTSVEQAKAPKYQRRRRDPYVVAQAKARRAANISRQAVLEKERTEAKGDPIRGIETEFVKSFDEPQAATDSKERLNFFLKQDDLDKSLEYSGWLNAPSPSNDSIGFDGSPSQEDQTRSAEWEKSRQIADEAVRRISSLELSNSKDRLRVNMQRCIDTFGRHNTDKTLAPRPSALPLSAEAQSIQRAGADTGSSEVQIAILTAKIRTLANELENRNGNHDKHNKRNLTLLVHRRQKLLQYLRRRERAGPRWQHCIETLGLTEGTWKGEIVLPR